LDDFDTEELCQTLFRYSLLLTFDLATRTIRLHDVIRSYPQKVVGDKLPTLHGLLLDAYALTRWADLPDNEPYLWDHLASHLNEASRLEELVTTVKDLRYLAHKTFVRRSYAAEADLAFTEQLVPDDVTLRLLKRNFANMGHLLNSSRITNDLAASLLSRLVHLQELSDLCQAFEQEIPRPYLASWHPLPDLPDPALIRTLSGHMGAVTGCAINPAGDAIVSTSWDDTLKVWDVRTGDERRTLRGHTDEVEGCAISPAGDYIVSASSDHTLKIWNAQTGDERHTLLVGHRDWVRRCAISPAGDFIVSAGNDATLKVWDASTGACLSTLYVSDDLNACAFHPDGEHLVAAGAAGVYFLRWVR
jgi:WD40 repeat protein